MRTRVTTPFIRLNRRSVLIAATVAITSGLLLKAQPTMAAESSMSAPDALKAVKAGEIILVDIRTPPEWAQTGIAEGAIALDMTDKSFVDSLVKLRATYPEKPIALICRTGNRSGYVFDALDKQGFPGLVDVSEGMAGGPNGQGWIPRGLPVYAGTDAEIAPRLKVVMKP